MGKGPHTQMAKNVHPNTARTVLWPHLLNFLKTVENLHMWTSDLELVKHNKYWSENLDVVNPQCTLQHQSCELVQPSEISAKYMHEKCMHTNRLSKFWIFQQMKWITGCALINNLTMGHFL